jgi:ABC-2 type transport system ATP-binding protein
MRIEELLRYTRALYPRWDPAYAKKLLAMFELDPSAKVRTLSMGQTAKAGLLTALAHRPEFLVLDEPSSGLDPIVRRDILGAVIREVATEGRTVLFSSHLLHEVESISDRVVMISAGKVIVDSPLEEVIRTHFRIVLRGANGRSPQGVVPGLLGCECAGDHWAVVCAGDVDAACNAARQAGFSIVRCASASLDDIFLAHAGRKITDTGE